MFHMAVNAHFYALIIPYFTLYIMVRIGSVMKRNAAMRGQRLRGSESYYRDVLCCSPTAVGVRQQSAAWGGGELRGSEEPQNTQASASPAAEAISEKRKNIPIIRVPSPTRRCRAEAIYHDASKMTLLWTQIPNYNIFKPNLAKYSSNTPPLGFGHLLYICHTKIQ